MRANFWYLGQKPLHGLHHVNANLTTQSVPSAMRALSSSSLWTILTLSGIGSDGTAGRAGCTGCCSSLFSSSPPKGLKKRRCMRPAVRGGRPGDAELPATIGKRAVLSAAGTQESAAEERAVHETRELASAAPRSAAAARPEDRCRTFSPDRRRGVAATATLRADGGAAARSWEQPPRLCQGPGGTLAGIPAAAPMSGRGGGCHCRPHRGCRWAAGD
mmetsp:Transcript_100900/g.300999  ORF Transcript_100900/g.300999 Transcript_100900/m.300999 type:complete len:217 (-) Transcript_100900:34-684(-)